MIRTPHSKTAVPAANSMPLASPRRSERGGILAWFALTVVAICLFVIAGGIYFAHRVRVVESGGNVHVETPFASVNVQHDNKAHPEAAGLPVYPGAKPVEGHDNAIVDLSSDFGNFGNKDFHIVAGKWQTPDSMAKVQQFYEEKLLNKTIKRSARKVEMFSVVGGANHVVALRDLGGVTEISLASFGEPRAN